MILNIYTLYNRKTGQYNPPVSNVYSHEQMCEHLNDQFVLSSGTEKALLSESDLYSLGTYDTKTAEIAYEKVFINKVGGFGQNEQGS